MNATCLSVLATVLVSTSAIAQAPTPSPKTAGAARTTAKSEQAANPKEAKCEPHGVAKKLCARCNPKLASVYKAKGDWCEEHQRPESQCVICHPELAKKGIK